MSVWSKKESVKKRVTSLKWSRLFQTALEDGENKNCAWENFDHSLLFAMLKATSSKHRLIKTSMVCVCIKPLVKKNDTTAMTIATNEAFIGWLEENCYLMG